MTETHGKIAVEVVYALPERQKIIALEVPEGTTAREAVEASGIDEYFEGLSVEGPMTLGIFGQVVAGDLVLSSGDRVEIYRPLKADPKEARKARAEKARRG